MWSVHIDISVDEMIPMFLNTISVLEFPSLISVIPNEGALLKTMIFAILD